LACAQWLSNAFGKRSAAFSMARYAVLLDAIKPVATASLCDADLLALGRAMWPR